MLDDNIYKKSTRQLLGVAGVVLGDRRYKFIQPLDV
jgi:hypothetical protein